MFELLKKLCEADGVSGDEGAVRDIIISEIDGCCDWRIDRLGNIIAFKKGKKPSKIKLMVDAHTDEVGLIITSITGDGFLKFKTVGGIHTSALLFRRVLAGGSVPGVICGKPIHLLSDGEAKKIPDESSLYIDIGAKNKAEAEKHIRIGDRVALCGNYTDCGDNILSKALDDRVGCAVLISLLKAESEYDFYATFTVQEEVGCRGAATAAFAVAPDAAIVLEGTTASDVPGVPETKTVCRLGEGPAVSFMDGGTVYDREYYNFALNSGIKCQPKSAVAGGNNSGKIHLSREGVRTVALSVPCRYIHSESSVASKEDIKLLPELTRFMIKKICGEETE